MVEGVGRKQFVDVVGALDVDSGSDIIDAAYLLQLLLADDQLLGHVFEAQIVSIPVVTR